MKFANVPRDWYCWAALTVTCLAFFAAFGGHSWHPTDYEMLVGFSWRVFAGKIPYRDFLYVRTPLSLYLHSAWFLLPTGWEIRASRLFYYFQFAAIAGVPATWALRAGVVRFGRRLPFLCVFFCVIALHNFPVMPWYTVDSVFFATIGLTAAAASLTRTRGTLLCRMAASLCFAAAALCKQNFAL